MGRMPTVAGSLLRSILFAGLAVLLFNQGQERARVSRTLIAEQTVRLTVQEADDRYYEEQKKARRRAMPYWGGAIVGGLFALGYLRKAARIHDRNKRRYPHDFTRPHG